MTEPNKVIIWHPCTEDDFYDHLNSRIHKLHSYEHLGNEKEPMELFVWKNAVTGEIVLRSALTVNKETFWVAQHE